MVRLIMVSDSPSDMCSHVLIVCLLVLGCVNGQNVIHKKSLVIRTLGKTALIKCEVDSSTLQSNALHWYKASKGGAFQRLMYYEAKTTAAKNDPGVSRRYSGSLDRGEVTLTISTLTKDDEGTFYCALWGGNHSADCQRKPLQKPAVITSQLGQQQHTGRDLWHISAILFLLLLLH